MSRCRYLAWAILSTVLFIGAMAAYRSGLIWMLKNTSEIQGDAILLAGFVAAILIGIWIEKREAAKRGETYRPFTKWK